MCLISDGKRSRATAGDAVEVRRKGGQGESDRLNLSRALLFLWHVVSAKQRHLLEVSVDSLEMERVSAGSCFESSGERMGSGGTCGKSAGVALISRGEW